MQDRDRDEGEVGKRDPRHLDREGEFVRIAIEMWRNQTDEQRHVGIGEGEQDELGNQQQRQDAAGELRRAVLAFGVQHMGVSRDIGGVEGAFAEDRAKRIGQANRDEISVSEGGLAQQRSDCHLAQKAGYPRQSRQSADREKIPEHPHLSNQP